jgi:hypothetical protein
MLYTWFPLAVLLLILLLIARFYQKFSGERTLFRFFVIPVVLFGAATVRYVSVNQMLGDGLGDALSAAGGIVLLGLSLWLYRRMMYHRRE